MFNKKYLETKENNERLENIVKSLQREVSTLSTKTKEDSEKFEARLFKLEFPHGTITIEDTSSDNIYHRFNWGSTMNYKYCYQGKIKTAMLCNRPGVILQVFDYKTYFLNSNSLCVGLRMNEYEKYYIINLKQNVATEINKSDINFDHIEWKNVK